MRPLVISVGEGILPALKRKEVTWERIAEVLTQHKAIKKKEEGRHFVGGVFEGDYRKEEFLEFRSLLVLDVDDFEGDYDDLLFSLAQFPEDLALVVYSTYSSTDANPTFRIVIPLSRDVTSEEYRRVSRQFANKLSYDVDEVSFKPSQMMWMPSSPTGEGFSFKQNGECLDVERYLLSEPESEGAGAESDGSCDDQPGIDDSDFELVVASQPLDISIDEIETTLDCYAAEGLNYDRWLEVGQALSHQYQHREEGYLKWLAWSEKSSKHDERQMRNKWRSFGERKSPITFATVIHHCGAIEQKAIESGTGESLYDKVRSSAEKVTDVASWTELKRKVQKLSFSVLPKELRQTIAGQVWASWGKSEGMTKSALLSALLPKRGKANEDDENGVVDNIYALPLPELSDEGYVLRHLSNLKEILRRLGVIVRYNVITKAEEVLIPDQRFSLDNMENASRAWLLSECSKFGYPVDRMDEMLTYIADQNPFNPVATWIESEVWDGVSRLALLLGTVVPKDKRDMRLRDLLIKRWLISAIVAAYSPDGVSAGGVLVFQGDQYIGKTYWFKKLVPTHLNLCKEGFMLRPDQKDSIIQAISFWLVELGELDSTFRKSDISALKAFITSKQDVVRRPYARRDSHYARRTVFFGSVNPEGFMHDETGNRRYWAIACKSIDVSHDINMQQLWAEVKALWEGGESHLLSAEELELLNESNLRFETPNSLDDFLDSRLAWNAPIEMWHWVTGADLLEGVGCKESSGGVRNRLGLRLKKLGESHPELKAERRATGMRYFVPPFTSGEFD